MSQKRSKALAKIIHWQTRTRRFLLRLMSRDKQQREGDHPVEDEVEGDDDAPVAADAVQVPVDLFGQVAGPDDQELAEGEVDVEHDEGESELAQVVLLGLAEEGGEGLERDSVMATMIESASTE